MKNKWYLYLTSIFLTALIFSCATGNDVASKRSVQKRKYNSGYYISMKKNKFGNKVKEEQVEIAALSLEKLDKQKSEELHSTLIENEEMSTQHENVTIPVKDVEIVNETALTTLTDQPTTGAQIVEKQSVETTVDWVEQEELAVVEKVSPRKALDNRAESGILTLLLVIIALIIPPLAVALYEGLTSRFLLNLIFFLIAIGAFVAYPLAGLFGLVAVIHAILIVIGAI